MHKELFADMIKNKTVILGVIHWKSKSLINQNYKLTHNSGNVRLRIGLHGHRVIEANFDKNEYVRN